MHWQKAVDLIRKRMQNHLQFRDFEGYRECSRMLGQILEDPNCQEVAILRLPPHYSDDVNT